MELTKSELEIADRHLTSAYVAFRSASGKWKAISPERSRNAMQHADSIVERLIDPALAFYGDWECDEMYRTWLES